MRVIPNEREGSRLEVQREAASMLSELERSLASLGMTEFLLIKSCSKLLALFLQLFRHHAA